MNVSLEDAIRLLSKWETEGTPVTVLLLIRDGGIPYIGNVSLAGFISGMSRSTLTITNFMPDGNKSGEVSIDLTGIQTFDYRDIREAKEPIKRDFGDRIASGLNFQVGNIDWSVYELVP